MNKLCDLKTKQMKTELQKRFEKETPSLKSDHGIEYLQTFISWLHLQVERLEPKPLPSDEIGVLFSNKSDCYTQDIEGDEMIQAMSKEIFISTVQTLLQDNYQPQTNTVTDIQNKLDWVNDPQTKEVDWDILRIEFVNKYGSISKYNEMFNWFKQNLTKCTCENKETTRTVDNQFNPICSNCGRVI